MDLKLGSWLMEITGTASGMSMGWMANYLMAFPPQLPLQLNPARAAEPASPQRDNPLTDGDARLSQPTPPKRGCSEAYLDRKRGHPKEKTGKSKVRKALRATQSLTYGDRYQRARGTFTQPATSLRREPTRKGDHGRASA